MVDLVPALAKRRMGLVRQTKPTITVAVDNVIKAKALDKEALEEDRC